MKEVEKAQWRFFVGLGLSLFLILGGIVMAVHVFTRYGQLFLTTQDDHLLHLAQSVDRNICNVLDRYEDSMSYLLGSPDFLAAQETWERTGEGVELQARLENSFLGGDPLITALLMADGDRVVFSTDGELSYTFLAGGGSGGLRPCVDREGNICLAITHEVGDGLVYAALMDLDQFYDRLAGPAFLEHNWILLTDACCRVLLYQQQKRAYVDRVDAVTGATSGQEGVEVLVASQIEQVSRMTSYEYFDAVTGESYTARMAVVPSERSENGSFAVGVVSNFEEEAAALNRTVLWLMFFGGVLVAGILLLVVLFLTTRRKDERELSLLRRKNEQMEELNRKTRELAHHQRLEIIGTMTSSIAHEFNNLLTPIMGYSIMVLEKIPPEEEEICDDLLEIYQASQKAKTIITRLSDLSRKNTGLTCQPVSPDELARRVLQVADPARPPKVEVRLETGCGDLWVHGNETQLSQLLLNLVLNSFHAMEETGGSLTLATAARGEEVLFRVADTGHGIPQEVLPKIFDPFFTTKESGKGTGLGLAIVRQAAEEHGGRIEVDSRVGEGTVITVTFPGVRRENGGD